MKNFYIIGIKPPGIVNVLGHGTITLENIDDQLAEKLYKEGLPYLQPTPEYRHVLLKDQKPIKTPPVPLPAEQVKPIKNPRRK